MNKRIFTSISIVLAVVIVVTGVLYAQETGKLKDAQDEIAGLEGNILGLGSNISALESDLADAEAEVSTLGGELTAAQAQVLTLEIDLAAAGARVSTLETDLATTEAEVSTLEGDLATTEAEVSTLEGDLAATEAEVSTLEGDLAATEAEVSTLEGDLAAAALGSTKVYMLPGLTLGSAVFPSTITVPVGTTITWINLSDEIHSATSTSPSLPFDSGRLPGGDSFSYTFTQPGVFYYSCSITGCRYHSQRSGIVIVE